MIYSICGILKVLELQESVYYAVIETSGGVAYEMKTTYTTAAQCPKEGEQISLLTHFSVREGAVDLYGFFDKEERRFFQMLISVSGIGPRAALSILSSVTPSQLALCIASGDSKALVACKGIGNKTAQRIVLELKDKVGNDDTEAGITGSESMHISAGIISGSASEAISALVVLGYSRSEAVSAVEKVKGKSSSVEDLIKEALKLLSTGR